MLLRGRFSVVGSISNLSILDCLAVLISSCWYMAPRVLCRLKAVGSWWVGLVCVADVDVHGDVGADGGVGALKCRGRCGDVDGDRCW